MARTDSGEKPASKHSRMLYGAVLIIVISSVALTPFLVQWVNEMTQPQQHYGMIVLKSESEGWHSGRLILTYQDGSSEQWVIEDYLDYTPVYEPDHPFYGYISTTRPSRNFTQSETCWVEYLCSGLNMTIGPLEFQSDIPAILYSNESLPGGLYISWGIGQQ